MRLADAEQRPEKTEHGGVKIVLKYGGQGHSGQAIKLFQVPPKISFTFHF